MFKNIVVALSANAAPLKAGLAGASRDVTAFDAKVKAANASGGALGKTLKTAAVVGVAVLAATLGSAVGKAVEFDREMRNVNSIMKVSHEEFATVSAEVLEISRRVPQSADVLAKGLYNIASSGFAGADGLTVLEASARAAAAGMTTTDIASKGVTSVLNAYGRGAEDAADVSDVLFKTVELGVLTFEGLSSALGQVIGIAAAAGIEIDEVSAAFAAMTKAGMNEAQSSTALARVIQGIIDPSEELAAHLRTLGFESGQAALDTEGLYGTIDLLRESTDGSVSSWQNLFPEIRAARGIFALTAAEGENYRLTAEGIIDVNNRAGATQSAYTEQLKGLALQWDLLKSSVNANLIQLGTQVLPVLITVTQGLGRFGDLVANAARGAGTALAPAWASLVSIGGDLASVVLDLARVVGPLAGALAGVVAMSVIAGFTALLSVVENLVGWLVDNEFAVAALAGIIAVALVPALAAAATQMGVMAVMGLVAVINGIATAAAAAAAALRAMSIAGGAIFLLGAALASAFFAMRDLKAEAQETAKALVEAFGQHIDASTSAGAVEQMRAQVTGLRDELRGMEEDLPGFWSRLGGGFLNMVPGIESGALRTNEAFKAIQDELGELDESMRRAEQTAVRVWEALVFEHGFSELDLTVEDVHALADALEVDLATATAETIQLLIDSAVASKEGKEGYEDLGAEIDAVASSQAKLTQALEEYMESLRAAFDPLFAAQKASQDLAEAQNAEADAHKAAAKAAKKHGEDSDEYREAVEAANDASWKSVDALLANEGALHDLKTALDNGEVSLATAKEMTDRWKASGDLLSESQKILIRDIEKLIDEAEEWGNTKADAEITATDHASPIIENVRRALGRLPKRTTTEIHTARTYSGRMVEADGGIVSFASGGGTRLPDSAVIQPAGTLVQWAEPETGGEAFIPMSQAKRARSEAILAEVARQFGHTLVPFAQGGVSSSPGAANGEGAVGTGGPVLLVLEDGTVIARVVERGQRQLARRGWRP